MSRNTHDSADADSETEPPRRTLLGAIGALTGVTALSGTGTAQQADGEVQTRGCSDAALTPEDWSDGSITVQACSTGGQVQVSVTGQISTDRYVADPFTLPSSQTLSVSPTDRQTLWFTGRLTQLTCSNDDLNIGIAHRG